MSEQQARKTGIVWHGKDVVLMVRATPNAKKSEVMGWEELPDDGGQALKVRLAAPPAEGKANKALCEYLAKLFAVPKRQVTLISGDTSRIKRIKIEGVEELPKELG